MAVDLLLQGGHVVTEGGVIPGNVAIIGETISGILGPKEKVEAKRVVDVSGLHLLPGVIDTHSHHREPGFTHKEDIISATTVCAAGGVTVSMAMPNVSPPPTTAKILGEMFDLYKDKAIIDYNINAAGTNIEEIPKIAEMDILSFKVFMVVDTGRSYPHMPGIGVHDHGKLLEIFQAVEKTGLPIMIHPHDQQLMDYIEQGYWKQDKRDFRSYAQAYAAHDGVLWNTAVAVLLQLQAATGVHLHLLHMQTRQSIEMVRAAKAEGRPVTSEINPWALWLGNDWANIERLGPYALSYFVAPQHVDAVWNSLLTGSTDMIATDHAPHTKEEKEPGWTNGWKCHTGTPSAQHYLSLLLTEVNNGRLSLERAVEIVSTVPAKVFKLYPKKGSIRPGGDADIVAVNLSGETTITNNDVLSKCGWTPYDGRKVKGFPVHTLLRGQFVFENGKVVGKPGYGKVARRAQN